MNTTEMNGFLSLLPCGDVPRKSANPDPMDRFVFPLTIKTLALEVINMFGAIDCNPVLCGILANLKPNFSIFVPVEIAYAMKKSVAGWGKVCHTSFMPDQGAADKVHFSMRIPIVLRKKLQRLAAQRHETLTDVVMAILQKSVINIELTPDDFRAIAEEMEKNAEAIQSKKKSK